MGEIPLHGKLGAGKVALVDDQDLPLLAGYRFTLGRRGYARAHVPREGRTPTTIELHLLLRDEKGRLYRDHINGDKLDNRRCNLRPATAQENAFNQKVNRTNKCGLKGVRQVGKKWQAVLHHGGRQLYLGSYATKELAAAAYNGAALALYREFARPNDLPEVLHAG